MALTKFLGGHLIVHAQPILQELALALLAAHGPVALHSQLHVHCLGSRLVEAELAVPAGKAQNIEHLPTVTMHGLRIFCFTLYSQPSSYKASATSYRAWLVHVLSAGVLKGDSEKLMSAALNATGNTISAKASEDEEAHFVHTGQNSV